MLTSIFNGIEIEKGKKKKTQFAANTNNLISF